MAFWEAAAAGSVPPQALTRPRAGASRSNRAARSNRQESDPWESGPELSAQLTRGAANQMRAAFALSVLQARRSLAMAFPGEPIEEELPELRTALSVVHLITLAVRRSIIQPVWECPPPYRRLFHIRRLGLTLNATGIEGRPLSWEDFGGLDSYIGLLEYCAASADSAGVNLSGKGQVVLPSHLSKMDFDDIIGLPGVEPGELAENTSTTPPTDYNGGNPPPNRTPVMPPEPVEATASKSPRPAADSPAIIAPDYGVNPVDCFVTERCETGEGMRILAGELYAVFCEWRRNAGQEPISQRAFGMRLTTLGLMRKRRGHGKHWWEGIRLAG